MVALLMYLGSPAQLFRHTYGWGSFNTAPSFCITPDGGYALAGSFSSTGSGQTDFVLIRTDSAGQFRWAKCYGSWGIESASHLLSLPDSGFLFVGTSNSFSTQLDYDGFIVRLNSNGDTLWQRSLGSPYWDFLHHALAWPDSRVVLSGSKHSDANGLDAGWLIMMDDQGQVLREKELLQDNNLVINRTTITPGGHLLAGGYTETPDSLFREPILIQLDTVTWDTLWTRRLPGVWRGELTGVSTLNNGQIIVAGYDIDSGATDENQLIMGLDSNGYFLWRPCCKTPGEERFNDVVVKDDTIYALGSTNSFGGGKLDFNLNLYDANGTFIAGPTFGDLQDEIGNQVLITDDRRILLFGTTTTFGPGLQSMLLVSTNDTSFYQNIPFVIGLDEPMNSSTAVQLFPNPTQGLLRIKGIKLSDECTWRLFASDGSLVRIGLLMTDDSFLQLEDVPAGYYVLCVQQKNGETFRKPVIIHRD